MTSNTADQTAEARKYHACYRTANEQEQAFMRSGCSPEDIEYIRKQAREAK